MVLEYHPDIDNAQKDLLIGILNHNIVCADALTFNFEKWEKPKNFKSKELF